MDKKFDTLITTQLSLRMQPHCDKIYQLLFPSLTRLRRTSSSAHRPSYLDRDLGIDVIIERPPQQYITIQEKVRHHNFYQCARYKISPPTPDFTQEYSNAGGTVYESPGEWFKLHAQYYFYGWANQQQTGLANWVFIDIAKYKSIVASAGGITQFGRKFQNRQHGKAVFFAFPISKIRAACVASGKRGGWYDNYFQERPSQRGDGWQN